MQAHLRCIERTHVYATLQVPGVVGRRLTYMSPGVAVLPGPQSTAAPSRVSPGEEQKVARHLHPCLLTPMHAPLRERSGWEGSRSGKWGRKLRGTFPCVAHAPARV